MQAHRDHAEACGDRKATRRPGLMQRVKMPKNTMVRRVSGRDRERVHAICYIELGESQI
jgi:hypothetical protein